MQKNLMIKKLVTLKQENKEVHADWTIIQQYLVDLNLNDKDEQEKTSILHDQQHQVGTSSSARLILTDNIFPFHSSLLSHSTILMHTSKQPHTSWDVVAHCQVISSCDKLSYGKYALLLLFNLKTNKGDRS